ncbi:MAG: hypothetical protein R2708_23305 [Vicinamibacterales bacterium]
MSVETLLDARRLEANISERALGCVVADGAVLKGGYHATLRKQDPRLPIVAVVDPADEHDPAFRRGVTTVVRPLDSASLVLAVSLAFGEGRQARRGRRTTAPRMASKVAGVAAAILDISADGVRLELPKTAASKLAPHFRLHVPAVALDVVVSRAWVGRAHGAVVQCGALLVDPDPSQRMAWQRLIELAGSRLVMSDAVDETSRATRLDPEASLMGRVSNLLAGTSLGGWAHHLSRAR